MRFTLRQLEIFAAVMATGQIRAAAERLYLSQAAVSQAMVELADALALTLFRRDGRTLRPTRAAYRLAELSAGPRATLGALPAQLHGTAEAKLAGPVHIAASSTIARYLLPERLAALAAHHPDLRLSQSSGNTTQVAARVARGEADLGFIEGPADREDLRATRWQTDRLVVIGAPGTPRQWPLSDLHSACWVMREPGSGTRRVFEQRLALAGLAVPDAHLVLDDAGAQVRAVAAGAGLACVSRAASYSAVAAGDIVTVALGDLIFERPLWMIRAARDGTDALVDRLIDMLAAPISGPAQSPGQPAFNRMT